MKWNNNPVPSKLPQTQWTPSPQWQASPANSTSRPDPTEPGTKQAPADVGIRSTQLLTQAPDWALWPQASEDPDQDCLVDTGTGLVPGDQKSNTRSPKNDWLKDKWLSLPKLFYKVRQRYLPLQVYRHQHKALRSQKIREICRHRNNTRHQEMGLKKFLVGYGGTHL